MKSTHRPSLTTPTEGVYAHADEGAVCYEQSVRCSVATHLENLEKSGNPKLDRKSQGKCKKSGETEINVILQLNYQ